MAVNISQALLQDSKQRDFDFPGQALREIGNVDFELDTAAFSKLFRVPPRGGGEACFFQTGGMQQMRNGADFLQGTVEKLHAFGVAGILLMPN